MPACEDVTSLTGGVFVMAEKAQSVANHVRFDPLFHFFVLPVFGLTLVVAVVDLVRHPSLWTAWTVVFLSAAVVAV